MPAFEHLDYGRFDVWATIVMEGIAVVEGSHRDACRAWLRDQGYAMTSIDFAQGVGPAVVALGELFHWEQQFGYRLTAEKRNLNALRDGFGFELQPGQGHVLEVLHAEVAHREDRDWFTGFLSIAHEHFLCQLALGARFFVTLILDRGSPLIAVEYEKLSIGSPSWTAAQPARPGGSGG